MTQDLADATGGALARLYRSRQASPVEVTQSVLRRIERLNPRYNAFCLVDPERALAAARQSEIRWSKAEPLSNIDGVPSTIKDLILTKGWPTLRGSRSIDRTQQWHEDAPAPARLREAGAVIIGKTTTPEFGWKGVCEFAAHRHHPQSVERRRDLRRFEWWRRRGGGLAHGLPAPRHGWGWLDPYSGRLLRYVRL